MPTIANAPSGEDTSLDGTEKFPVSGSKFVLISTIRNYIWNYLTSLTADTPVDADSIAFYDAGGAATDKVTLANLVDNWLKSRATTWTNQTFTAPAIADFTNMAHDHGDADDGGVLVAAAIAGLHGYTLLASSGVANSPADATTYYFGSVLSRTFFVTAGNARVYIPKAGTITRVEIHWRQETTPATAETSTIYLRLNDTTDTVLSAAVKNDGTLDYINVTGLSIAVVAGDYYEIKWVTPSWATNPVGLTVQTQAYVSG